MKEAIHTWLEQHTSFNKGYDISTGPFPLPASIGEGFTFQHQDFQTKKMLDYVAMADRKDGKRKLFFEITSFIGMCGGACHYFCRAHSYINMTEVGNPGHTIGGYLGGIEIPRESESLEFDLGIPVTAEMIEQDMGHYKYHEPGDCGVALRSKQPFFEVIETLKQVFDMNAWTFVIEDRT